MALLFFAPLSLTISQLHTVRTVLFKIGVITTVFLRAFLEMNFPRRFLLTRKHVSRHYQ